MLRKLYRSKLIHRTWLLQLKFFRHYFQTPITVIKRRKHEFNPEINVAMRPWSMDPDKVKVVFVFSGGPFLDRKLNHGLPISTPQFGKNVIYPSSWNHLVNEMCRSLDYTKPKHGSLAAWHDKGVMMFNLVLTNNTRHHHAHDDIGWEYLAYDTIRYLSDNKKRIAFVFFGRSCWFLSRRVDEKKHLVLRVPYPSPLGKGLNGSNIFPTVLKYIREDRDFFRLPTCTQTKRRKKSNV